MSGKRTNVITCIAQFYIFTVLRFVCIAVGIGIVNNNNNNNNSRISIPPSVVTSEAVAEPVRSRKSAIVG